MYNEGKVSIIVPVYNAENFLHRTVDSILAQTYENWELLLADDCSTDQSRDIMKSYTDERIHCFYCEKNSGPAGARNLALRKASGQYIAFLDADDFWLPQKLEKQISFMKKGNYPFSFTSYEFADANAVRSGTVAHAPERVGYQEILKSSTIAPSTAVLDRNQIDTALIYMPENVRLEDVDGVGDACSKVLAVLFNYLCTCLVAISHSHESVTCGELAVLCQILVEYGGAVSLGSFLSHAYKTCCGGEYLEAALSSSQIDSIPVQVALDVDGCASVAHLFSAFFSL